MSKVVLEAKDIYKKYTSEDAEPDKKKIMLYTVLSKRNIGNL